MKKLFIGAIILAVCNLSLVGSEVVLHRIENHKSICKAVKKADTKDKKQKLVTFLMNEYTVRNNSLHMAALIDVTYREKDLTLTPKLSAKATDLLEDTRHYIPRKNKVLIRQALRDLKRIHARSRPIIQSNLKQTMANFYVDGKSISLKAKQRYINALMPYILAHKKSIYASQMHEYIRKEGISISPEDQKSLLSRTESRKNRKIQTKVPEEFSKDSYFHC